MSEVFFTSDLHIGHTNGSVWRNFQTIEEHNEFILDSYNEVIHPNDTVHILGDVIFSQATYLPLLGKLNGQKQLVIGNHEHKDMSKYIPYFKSIMAYSNFGEEFLLTHMPVHATQLSDRFKGTNVHGHIHANEPKLFIPDDHRYFNVNVEFHEYKPIHLLELRTMIRLKKSSTWNEYEGK